MLTLNISPTFTNVKYFFQLFYKGRWTGSRWPVDGEPVDGELGEPVALQIRLFSRLEKPKTGDFEKLKKPIKTYLESR